MDCGNTTLTWKRKLPFQHHLRERLDYPDAPSKGNNGRGDVGPTTLELGKHPSNFGPSKKSNRIAVRVAVILSLQPVTMRSL